MERLKSKEQKAENVLYQGVDKIFFKHQMPTVVSDMVSAWLLNMQLTQELDNITGKEIQRLKAIYGPLPDNIPAFLATLKLAP